MCTTKLKAPIRIEMTHSSNDIGVMPKMVEPTDVLHQRSITTWMPISAAHMSQKSRLLRIVLQMSCALLSAKSQWKKFSVKYPNTITFGYLT